MARSNEPLWWAPFFAGAGISALFMPITIVLTIFAGFGWIDAYDLRRLMTNPLVRIYLFLLISLSLFHAVHRFRFILIDFGLKSARQAVALFCYGFAIVGTLLSVVFLLRLY